MDDDKKKPGRGAQGRGPGAGGDRPRGEKRFGGQRSEGGAKPFRKREDGDKKPFRARPDGEGRVSGAREDGPRKSYRPREEGDRKPFEKRGEGDRKPFRPREDGDRKPYRKREDGEGRPAGAREDGPRKSYRPREEGDRKPFEKRGDGDRRPFRPREDGDRKPFRKREDGDRKPFRKREDSGQRPVRPGRREREETPGADAASGGVERIARRLARAGVASRRDAEDMIAAGRITLNGKVLDTPAINVGDRDRIEIDGNPIPAIERTRLFLFHKPSGVVTTNRDPEGRKTVFDVLPKGLPRLMTVGRLDINTEGLLLLTNDGGLSRVLELPTTGWLRRYRVRVHGKVELAALESLKDGIAVDGVFYGAIEAALDREQGSNAWLTIGLREGKNREVKNILGALGLDVTRLIRISYGPFQLGELAEGEVRELKGKMLRDQLGDRLIEESGANFEAPVLNEFTNKPVSAKAQERTEDSGPRPNRKREREQKREEALGRMQTKPQRFSGPKSGDAKGGKFGGKPGKPGMRDEREPEKPRTRNANVWMAPGARPMGEKKAAAVAERNEGRRYAGKPRPEGGKPGGKGPRKPCGGA